MKTGSPAVVSGSRLVLGPLEFSGTTALYQAQLKLAIGKSRDGKGRTSFTVGAAGAASYLSFARWTPFISPPLSCGARLTSGLC